MASRIKEARRQRGWSQPRLIAEMERAAQRRGTTLPSRETLKSRVSRWENNHARPDEFYRQLLREALGLDDRELGFTEESTEHITTAVDELRSRLVTARAPDRELLDALARQTDAIRRQDRQYGAGPLLEQMRAHVANVDQHLSHAAFEVVRKPLAQVLADAAALAGWQALDLVATDQAWRLFETASRAARQAEDCQLYAFSRMEQAHVLADLSSSGDAADLARDTWAECEKRVTPSLRCWLAAGTAEMLAAAGERPDARGMIRLAERLADGLDDERPPYLVFDRTHLDRWVGHNLVLLHDSAAEPQLREVAATMDASFARAGAALHLDLAVALAQRGVIDEAKGELSQADSLARRVGSRRQLQRLSRLRTDIRGEEVQDPDE